jgi:hypothetical protein
MKKAFVLTGNFLANYLHLLSVIITCFLWQPIMAQDSSYSNYLQQHHEKISIDGNNKFDIFDEAFYQNQVFLVSESHGYYKPHEVDLELFKQINKVNGVHHYLAEIDFSQAYYLNKYLTTGNEDLLKAIYQYWYNTKAQWGCKAGFEKWKKMFAYNQTLSADKKIIILGLDEAQDLNMNVRLLNGLLNAAGYKSGSDKKLDSIRLFGNINLDKDSARRAFTRYARKLDTIIGNSIHKYKKIFTSSFFSFSYIIHNIASKMGREAKIFENFNTLYTQYKLADEKFYGFWGRFHAMQDSINHDMPFAGMLRNSTLPLKNKIVSIPVFCTESSSMIPTGFLPPIAQQKGTVYSKVNMVNDDSYIYQVKGIKALKNLADNSTISIFKLTGAASPYFNGLNLVESTSGMDKNFEWNGNKNTATTNYFQYAIVVRNSDWAIPYGDNKAD